MNYELFTKQLENLNNDFQKELTEEDRAPIYDGPVNAKRYWDAPIKIAWLLKEAYDEIDGKGGGWNYSVLLDKDNLYEDFFRPHASRATWHPIVYVSYGILKNFKLWDDMDYIRDDPKEMTSVIRDIAIVNVQKLPARNVAHTDFRDINKAFENHKHLLKRQLEILNPDIIIGASTLHLFNEIFEINDGANHKESITYYFKDKKLFIDAYHPAQTIICRETYVNDIVGAAKEWHILNNKAPNFH
jgi:hypothetical protein